MWSLVLSRRRAAHCFSRFMKHFGAGKAFHLLVTLFYPPYLLASFDLIQLTRYINKQRVDSPTSNTAKHTQTHTQLHSSLIMTELTELDDLTELSEPYVPRRPHQGLSTSQLKFTLETTRIQNQIRSVRYDQIVNQWGALWTIVRPSSLPTSTSSSRLSPEAQN